MTGEFESLLKTHTQKRRRKFPFNQEYPALISKKKKEKKERNKNQSETSRFLIYKNFACEKESPKCMQVLAFKHFD